MLRRLHFLGLVLLSLGLGACGPTEVPEELADVTADQELDGEESAAADLAQWESALTDPCVGYSSGAVRGDDVLVIVNKKHGRQLRRDWTPADLTSVPARYSLDGRSVQARRATVAAFRELADEALRQGMHLSIRSAYRSFRDQCVTHRSMVKLYGTAGADRRAARPGRSEHQLGLALDIAADAGAQVFGTTPESAWLQANAFRYGFGLSYPSGQETVTGYQYEPWHWRFIGKSAGGELHAKGLWLFDFLAQCDAHALGFSCQRP